MTTVKTGHTVQTSGIYKCETHPNHQITLVKGKEAPPCDKYTAHAATWILVDATHH